MNLPLRTSSFAELGSLSREQWLGLVQQQAPRIVSAVAVIGLAWLAAQLTWLLLTPKAAVAVGTAPALTATTPTARTAVINTQTIGDAHLFGVPNAAPTSATGINNLPQTQMSLVLAGTIALNDPEAGFAILGENAATAKFYKVGATINGAVRLHSVYSDRVIIERNGALETLVLPRGPSPFAAPPPRPTVNETAVDNLRRAVTNNPSALGQLLRAQPVFTNGVQKGYRVYPARDRSQFIRLGLQPGDLITAVNGTPLDDPNRSGEILNTMTSSSSVNVSIERNGSVQQLNLDIAQISLPDTAHSSEGAPAPGEPQGTPAVGPNGL